MARFDLVQVSVLKSVQFFYGPSLRWLWNEARSTCKGRQIKSRPDWSWRGTRVILGIIKNTLSLQPGFGEDMITVYAAIGGKLDFPPAP